eukprot:11768580-Ditylum_brightwellii.AAC.1
MTKKFKEKFTKILKDQGSSVEGKSKNATELMLEEKRSFVKSLYKISKVELGIVITKLDKSILRCLPRIRQRMKLR